MSDTNHIKHFGVKGMKWGKSKAKTPAAPDRAPSAARAALLGDYGKKEQYKNAGALKKRTEAGKIIGAAVISGVGGVVVGAIKSNNPKVQSGLNLAAFVLNTSSSVLAIQGAVTGLKAVGQERASREKN